MLKNFMIHASISIICIIFFNYFFFNYKFSNIIRNIIVFVKIFKKIFINFLNIAIMFLSINFCTELNKTILKNFICF